MIGSRVEGMVVDEICIPQIIGIAFIITIDFSVSNVYITRTYLSEIVNFKGLFVDI